MGVIGFGLTTALWPPADDPQAWADD